MSIEMLKIPTVKMDGHRINMEELEATVVWERYNLVAINESWLDESHD